MQIFKLLNEERLQQAELAAEIVIECRLGYTGRLDDLLDPNAIIAVGHKEPQRTGKELRSVIVHSSIIHNCHIIPIGIVMSTVKNLLHVCFLPLLVAVWRGWIVVNEGYLRNLITDRDYRDLADLSDTYLDPAKSRWFDYARGAFYSHFSDSSEPSGVNSEAMKLFPACLMGLNGAVRDEDLKGSEIRDLANKMLDDFGKMVPAGAQAASSSPDAVPQAQSEQTERLPVDPLPGKNILEADFSDIPNRELGVTGLEGYPPEYYDPANGRSVNLIMAHF